jgi:hypothetical protein
MKDTSSQTPPKIQILGDGSRCLVQGQFVALPQLGTHLKDVLGFKPGTQVCLTSDPSKDLSFSAVNAVATHLKEAGFVLETAYFA